VPVPRSLTLAGSFEGGLTLAAQMADEAAAKALVETLEQGLQMVRMQAADNPEVQKVQGANELLERIAAKAEGKKVTLTVPGGGAGSILTSLVAGAAIPSLTRARVSANEAAAIGDIRSVLSAQMVFASAANGSYGDLSCLAEPGSCVAGYAGPPFLDATLATSAEKGGYKRTFHPGPAAGTARQYQEFAYTAVPTALGESGNRSFCGDASGVVCSDASGADIAAQNGRCPASCAPLDGGLRPEYAPPPPPPPPPPVRRAPPSPRPPAAKKSAAPAPAEAAPAPEAPPEPTQPVRVGGNIKEPRKTKNVSPVYPPMARQARVQGVVILECRISPEGRISEVKILRGIPLLDGAAVDAVKQWEYEPTLLNGVPVPVIMTVTVNFKLS
jgi:protein TonB